MKNIRLKDFFVTSIFFPACEVASHWYTGKHRSPGSFTIAGTRDNWNRGFDFFYPTNSFGGVVYPAPKIVHIILL